MQKRESRSRSSGFTLIELVVVIIVLGVLSAIAAQKFFDINRDARIAVLNGARGPLASTAELAHAKYLLTAPLPTTMVVQGVTITFSTAAASGYPQADAGFAAAAGLGSADWTLVTAGSAASSSSPATSATEIAFIPNSIAGSPAALNCYVKYGEPTTATGAPTITMVTTSC